MSVTRFPNGVSSFGMPVFGAGLNIPPYRGTVWYVDSERGSGTAGSKELATPGTSINGAIDAASPGDIILIYPGSYREDVVVDKDYITLLGAAQGYGRPDLRASTAGAATLHVDNAQGFVAIGIRFDSIDSLGAAGHVVRQEGNGYLYQDCVFDGRSSDNASSVLLRLQGDADDDSYTASEGRIVGCLFRGAAGRALAFDTGAAPGNGVGCTHVEVKGNRFMDNTGVDIVTLDTGGGTYSVQDTLIEGNWFMSAKNKATWIDFTTANGGAAGDQDGVIAGNYFADDNLDTTAVAMVGTGFVFVGNFDTVGVQDGSGLD